MLFRPLNFNNEIFYNFQQQLCKDILKNQVRRKREKREDLSYKIFGIWQPKLKTQMKQFYPLFKTNAEIPITKTNV